MKIQLDLEERKYIYALLKLFASKEETREAKMFWAELASRLGPRQTTAHLRRKEVSLILDIVSKAVDTINGPVRAAAADLGQSIRADALDKVLAGAKDKLAKKLAETQTEGEEDGV